MQLRSVIYAAMLLTPGVAAAQMPLPSFEPAQPLNGLYIGAGVGAELVAKRTPDRHAGNRRQRRY